MPLDTSIPDQVRDDAAFVMSTAQHVQIAHERVAEYAAHLVGTCPLVTSLDTENHFVSKTDKAKTAAYVFALDSINFGSGVFAQAQAAGVDLEYAPVARKLKEAFERNQWDTPQKWQEIAADDCHALFAMPKGATPGLDQLMADFSQNLRWTAGAVVRDFGGFKELLRDYHGRGLDVLNIVAAWPHFADVTRYLGRDVAIYKRAQILLADLELAIAGEGASHFGGLKQLTCFADNMVPHVLRSDGILAYSDELAAMIDGGQMIAAGSVMETELRCAAIHAVELMRKSLSGQFTSVNLDHMLWHRGYQPGFSHFRTHRTISHWY